MKSEHFFSSKLYFILLIVTNYKSTLKSNIFGFGSSYFYHLQVSLRVEDDAVKAEELHKKICTQLGGFII